MKKVDRGWYDNGSYNAETMVFTKRHPVDADHALSLHDSTIMVQKWLGGDWDVVRGQTPHRSFCSPHRKFISLGRHAPLWIVLHEIAHGLADINDGHNANWREKYVKLVEVEMSVWWADRLRAAFKRVGY